MGAKHKKTIILEKEFLRACFDREQFWPWDLRGVFYHVAGISAVESFVNTLDCYRSAMRILKRLREEGQLPWRALTDSARQFIEPYCFEDVSAYLDRQRNHFSFDWQHHQPHYVEVMVEKATLIGAIAPVCRRYSIPLSMNKGFTSRTFLDRYRKRLAATGKHGIILTLSDMDPSGHDMPRDIQDYLLKIFDCDVEVRRVALDYEQISELGLVESFVPIKPQDPRTPKFLEKYTADAKCYELDAVDPQDMAEILENAILDVFDPEQIKKDKIFYREELELNSEYQSRLDPYKNKIREEMGI